MAIYTLGVWTVKPGREDAFIEAWNAMATATAADYPGASAVLLRDRDEPTKFISSGPWNSLDQIETWRASSTFQDGVGRIRELIERFEPHTMDLVVTVGSP
jgi:heme-degrading monooxygenase HmoA